MPLPQVTCRTIRFSIVYVRGQRRSPRQAREAQAPSPRTGGDLMSASFFVSPQELLWRIGTADAPTILDACRREIYDAGAGVIPTAQWHQPETFMEWVPGLPAARLVVLACRYGHNLSQMIAAELRGRGVAAQVLEGGRQAWSEAGLPVVNKAVLERFAPKSPSLWVTRRRPKIDRVACPWLI